METTLQKITGALDRAIAGALKPQNEAAVIAPTPSPLRLPSEAPLSVDELLAESSRTPGSWNKRHRRAAFGVPAELKAVVAQQAQIHSRFRGPIGEIRALGKRIAELDAERDRLSSKSADRVYQESLDANAEAILTGASPDRFQTGPGSIADTRKAMIDALRGARLKEQVRAWELIRPLLVAAEKACGELLALEKEAEQARYKKFGVPFTAPSEILLSLAEFASVLTAKLESACPSYPCSLTDLACGLL